MSSKKKDRKLKNRRKFYISAGFTHFTLIFLFIQIRCRIGCNLSTVFLYAVGYGVVRIIK